MNAAAVKGCLGRITGGESLEEDEARDLFDGIMAGQVSPVMIAALLAALKTKGETVEEIVGAARAMRAHATRIDAARSPLVDTCGTGGDFSGTFNVSTAAAFVAAAAGAAIAKHGNRAASSRCGSADVLEAAGAVVDLPAAASARVLDDVGIGFFYAPNCHPAMRHAIGVRRELGIRTLFNLLGPLTNPAGARRQVIGVPAADMLEPLVSALVRLGSEHALVVHGHDGLDEISVSDRTAIAELRDGTVERFEIEPSDLGLATQLLTELAGGDAAVGADILRSVLGGTGSKAQTAFVAANAGAALLVGGRAETLRAGVDGALEILASGAALEVLDRFVDATRAAAQRENP